MGQGKSPFDPDYISQVYASEKPRLVQTSNGTRVVFPKGDAWRKLDEHPVTQPVKRSNPKLGKTARTKVSEKEVKRMATLAKPFVTAVGEFQFSDVMEILRAPLKRLLEVQKTYHATRKTPFMWDTVLWLFKQEPGLVWEAAKLLDNNVAPPTVEILREKSRLRISEMSLLLDVSLLSLSIWRAQEKLSTQASSRHRRVVLLVLKLLEISPQIVIGHLIEYRRSFIRPEAEYRALDRIQERFK
jgi:hypothetical protein